MDQFKFINIYFLKNSSSVIIYVNYLCFVLFKLFKVEYMTNFMYTFCTMYCYILNLFVEFTRLWLIGHFITTITAFFIDIIQYFYICYLHLARLLLTYLSICFLKLTYLFIWHATVTYFSIQHNHYKYRYLSTTNNTVK
jgi:hypothetical protein